METCVYKITCIRIVAAAFFILEKNKWKQPRGPSEVNWINKLCVHIREYYTAIKRNDLLIHRKMGEFEVTVENNKNLGGISRCNQERGYMAEFEELSSHLHLIFNTEKGHC